MFFERTRTLIPERGREREGGREREREGERERESTSKRESEERQSRVQDECQQRLRERAKDLRKEKQRATAAAEEERKRKEGEREGRLRKEEDRELWRAQVYAMNRLYAQRDAAQFAEFKKARTGWAVLQGENAIDTSSAVPAEAMAGTIYEPKPPQAAPSHDTNCPQDGV